MRSRWLSVVRKEFREIRRDPLLIWIAAVLLSASPIEATELNGKARGISKPEEQCWKGGKDETNPDRTKREVPVLPSKFDGVKVRRPSVEIKLCIDVVGRVDRTILLTSSGNTDIDEFYRAAFKAWTFKPLLKPEGAVSSAWTIGVNWNPR